jgi:hypothetical protein
MGFGFFRADYSILHQAAYIGMIVRQPGNGRTAHQIKAAIADVRIVELVVEKNDRCGCRPHAMQFRMCGSVAQNAFVSDLKSGKQKRLHIRFGSFGENFPDGIDRDPASLLSTFVTAHAIGDNGEPALAGEILVGGRLPIGKLVFVVFSLAANVTHARQLNSRPYSHHTSHAVVEQTQNRFSVT